ncbi:MAG: flagellar motor switch protein FliN [Nitrospinae bacterium]|nr:flagellar motor switch protein FliN [Nitrospinota bacterium]
MQDSDDFESLDELGDIGDVGGAGPAAGEGGEGAVVAEEGEQKIDVKNLDLILDIPLTVTVELGRSKMLINDLLQLSQGSVIELTKLVGEPLEVLVNQKLVARGEVVVVNEKFGVRLTDIVSPMERVQSLG